MSLIDNLKVLPKEYVEVIALKIFFGAVAVMGAVALVIAITAIILHRYHYPNDIILLGATGVWVGCLLIIAAVYYGKLQAYQRKAMAIKNVMNQITLENIGVFVLDKIIQKLRRKLPSKPVA